MSGVRLVEVDDGEDGLRLDRWFKARFPGVTQGKLQKLLRTGQIRLDGSRAKANDRVAPGQTVRVPPNLMSVPAPETDKRPSARDIQDLDRVADELKNRILFQDDDVLAIDKPAGLAVQGGSRTKTHIDAVLDRLRLGAKERPRLVHRLDRDTSGVLLLGRTRLAANMLSKAFKSRDAEKSYWALAVGVPEIDRGVIDAALLKKSGNRGESVQVDNNAGKPAKTRYWIVDAAGSSASWLCLQPLTGRTHQLRVHCQLMGTAIFGDGKYGRRQNALAELGLDRMLHLHARRIAIPMAGRADIDVTAPLPEHMLRSWQRLGFDPDDERALEADLD